MRTLAPPGQRRDPAREGGASALEDLFPALGSLALRLEAPDRFRCMTPPCDWFLDLPRCPPIDGSSLRLHGISDYLDQFLTDALAFWSLGQPGVLRSGPWVECGRTNPGWPLQAQALWQGNGGFLVITHLAEDYQEKVRLLQAARNHLLSEELLEREVTRRTRAIRQREEEIAIRLLGAARRRDEETGAHVRRIGLYCAAIAQTLGWDAGRVADIRVAAPMHDIGKIGIPDAILLKPGRLDPEEYRIMQQHTVIGASMLRGSDIPLLNMGSDIALCHHEKWDGTGYPNGLRGEAIPLAARVVALVDVYDAMVHRRVYKEPIAEEVVLASMSAAAGSHFDPHLFRAFVETLPALRAIRETVKD